jgi:hypothetical protein
MPYSNVENQLAWRKRFFEWYRAQKSRPCHDCGIQYPYYIMQFDHVRGQKMFNLSKCASSPHSKKKVEAEIAKCEVVCANCHASRTWQRRQPAE